MTTVNNTDALAGLGLTGQPETTKRNDEIGQDDYLTLMLAQFENQDPFEPMTNGEFLGQIAQFGTVSGIQELQDSFTDLSASLQSEQALQAATLVGQRVLARSDIATLTPGEPIDGAIELDSSVQSLDIEITDASGQLVRTLSLGAQDAGFTEFSWDGIGSDGEAVAAGEYRLAARVNRGGVTETLEPLVAAQIDSVTLGRNGEGLTLNTSAQGGLSFAQVERIL